MNHGDIPFVAMHGNVDGTVPYATAMIVLLGLYPIMVVDGSYSIAEYADSIGVQNNFYTFFGADHVPYSSSTAYMDTTVRFVSNFLYRQLGCTPSNPLPLDNTFSTGINSVTAENDFMIYPNPASDKLKIKVNNQIDNLMLFDISGRKLLEIDNITIDYSLDISNFNSGIYFYKINSNKKIFSGKVIIQ